MSLLRCTARAFAHFLVDHHGDGQIALWYKAAPGVQQELIDAEPNRFYVPAYVGPRGWVALNLEASPIDWSEIEEMMKQAYQLAAPKKLANSSRDQLLVDWSALSGHEL